MEEYLINPLNAVNGFAIVLKGEIGDHPFLKQIIDQAEVLNKRIKQLGEASPEKIKPGAAGPIFDLPDLANNSGNPTSEGK